MRRVAIALRLAEPEEADLIERARSRRFGAVATHIVRARSRWGIFKWMPKVRARRALIRAANAGAFSSTQPISLLDHIGLRAAVDELVRQEPTVPMHMFSTASEPPVTPAPETVTTPAVSPPEPISPRVVESTFRSVTPVDGAGVPARQADSHTPVTEIVTVPVTLEPEVVTPPEKIAVTDPDELIQAAGRIFVELDPPRSYRQFSAEFRKTHSAAENRLRAVHKRISGAEPETGEDDQDDPGFAEGTAP
jgi:hypothetical protein